MCVCVLFLPHIFHVQRFKGTEPVEEVTEQVKAVKIEEKPKEVKAEVVDEVPAGDFCQETSFFGVHLPYTPPVLLFTGSTQVRQVGDEER